MRSDTNDLLTRTGPGTPCGTLMRRYWQPVALVDEFNPALDPRMEQRPVKPVRALGQDFVLWRDGAGTYSLLDRDCPHRGADLAFGRYEPTPSGGCLRCPFHGWKFDASGQCQETPAEPEGSHYHLRIKQRSYPVVERSGVLWAWLAEPEIEPPMLPYFDCFAAPESHTFAFKGLWNANWLQAYEVGIDPAHPSFLHRFLEDEALDEVGDNAAGKQFRSASAGAVKGAQWPMSRIMREFHKPEIQTAATPWGMQITALRRIGDAQTHVRVTQAVFPHTFVIPLSETMTITQLHLPVDDTHTYWYSIFTSFAGPIDKEAMREQRLAHTTLPDYLPKSGRHNAWGFDAAEQRTKTFSGLGEDDINIHDQWAVESMGPLQNRTREHLATTDKAIIANRRALQAAIAAVAAGHTAPGMADPAMTERLTGPDTIDGVAPANQWNAWWRAQAQAKRDAAPWDCPTTMAAQTQDLPTQPAPL